MPPLKILPDRATEKLRLRLEEINCIPLSQPQKKSAEIRLILAELLIRYINEVPAPRQNSRPS